MVIIRKMIRRLLERDLDSILEVINDAAQVYKGVIPDDRWKEPYMSAKELGDEIDSGVDFFGLQEEGRIIGLMGTWKAASWAIQFYEAYGFTLVSSYEKDRLLREYWNIPERQIETSLVLTFNKE